MTMLKTKAAFRAVREECGYSQQDVADEACVTVQSVKKWENPNVASHNPPDAVWLYLLAMREDMRAEAEAAARRLADAFDGDEVVLSYYRTQDGGNSVGYQNATMLAVGRILDRMEIPYTYQYA